MGRKARLVALSISNALIPVAVLVFAFGFFPYKPFISGLAEYRTLEYGEPPDPPFDKVVFMVVDALRRLEHHPLEGAMKADLGSDFVYSEDSGFKYTQRWV